VRVELTYVQGYFPASARLLTSDGEEITALDEPTAAETNVLRRAAMFDTMYEALEDIHRWAMGESAAGRLLHEPEWFAVVTRLLRNGASFSMEESEANYDA